MIQSSCRYLLRNLKVLKNLKYNPIFYELKRELLQNFFHRQSKNIALPTRYFVSSAASFPRRKLVGNFDDLKNYITEEKPFYLKLLINILDNIEFENLSSKDATLLLTCCGSSVADSSKQSRDKICQIIYKKLMDFDKLNLDICHTYIDVCTENAVVINYRDFLKELRIQPSQETYKLLLNNICEKGHTEQSMELLEVMKSSSISVNEEMFNALVLAHTIQGGVKYGEMVVQTMRAAQIAETAATRLSLLKGALQRDNSGDIDYVLRKYPISLSEKQLLQFLEIIGLTKNISWLDKIKSLYSNVITRDYINALSKVCIHLVHMDSPECAMAIYQEFVDAEKEPNYGFFLLKEMLHCNTAVETIIKLCENLRKNNLNDYAMEMLTELALRHKYTEVSWTLLQNMSTLRPHFFWPLLVDANKEQGEIGVFNVLQKMVDMNVKIERETLEYYVLPFCKMDDLKVMVKKLTHLNITVKEAVCSILPVLLLNNQIERAADLCNSYNVSIVGDKIFKLISSSWASSKKDEKSTVVLLQKYCESNSKKDDLVEDFLIETLNSCESSGDFKNYIKLLELINESKLKISPAAVDYLNKLSSAKCISPEDAQIIKDAIYMLLDFSLNPEPVHIPHPRNMTIDELECHLIELREKNMETRGVLRKLIQLHANMGIIERVNELREQFLAEGYEETVGMKSSLMHSYIKEGHLDPAVAIYNEIKIVDPHFKIDSFKVIDLANLLVKEGKYGEAIDIVKTETVPNKLVGGPSMIKNCWQLLNSYEDVDMQLKMFEFLVENKYCKPSNIIFGPLVRIHLKRGDLQKSVDVYENIAKEYKCTPLQLELIKEILKEGNQSFLERFLEVTKKIHGQVPTQTVLIAALAENGQDNLLQKLLMENRLDIKKELCKRCERWVQESKVGALLILAKACERVPKVFDVNFVYNCIMRTYSLNNDYKSAIEFHELLLEKDVIIDKELEIQLDKLKQYKSKKSANHTN